MALGIKMFEVGGRDIDPPEWVVEFDPNVSATDPPSYPTGRLVSDPDPALALKFESYEAGLEFWRQPSVSVPLRPDGLPNRPLTAYTVEILDL